MPRLIQKGLIALLILATSGCATRAVQTLTSLPLPADQSVNCCWQALQHLDIDYGKQHYQLTGALAQTATGTTLVLLDPFGRRLLSVTKHDDTLQTYRSPELPENLPERFLLASSMLVWWPLADWQQLLPTKGDWQVSATADARVLNYRGRAIVRATYPPGSLARTEGMNATTLAHHEVVLVEHQYQPLRIRVVSDSWEPL